MHRAQELKRAHRKVNGIPLRVQLELIVAVKLLIEVVKLRSPKQIEKVNGNCMDVYESEIIQQSSRIFVTCCMENTLIQNAQCLQISTMASQMTPQGHSICHKLSLIVRVVSRVYISSQQLTSAII